MVFGLQKFGRGIASLPILCYNQLKSILRGEIMKKLYISILRSLFVFFAFAGISRLAQAAFYSNFFGEQFYFGEHFFEIWNFIILLFVYQSTVYALRVSDRRARDSYCEKSKNHISLGREILKICASFDFLCDFLCSALLSSLLPASFCLGSVTGAFFFGANLDDVQTKLFTLAVILPIFFVLGLMAHFFVRKQWARVRLRSRFKGSSSKDRGEIFDTVKNIVIVAFVYVLSFSALPWIIPGITALWAVTGGFLWLFFAAVALIVLAVVATYYIRALIKRKAFLRRLDEVCRNSRARLDGLKKPYASVFSITDGFNFSVTKGENRYDCKFICGVFPGSPIVFSDKGVAICNHPFHIGNTELFSLMTKIDFGFESDGKKILIVLPIPKKIYVGTVNSGPRPADTGEKAGEYTIYNASGFLGALERDCLTL